MEQQFRETFANMLNQLMDEGELHGLCYYFKCADVCKKQCDICPVNDYTDFNGLILSLKKTVK